MNKRKASDTNLKLAAECRDMAIRVRALAGTLSPGRDRTDFEREAEKLEKMAANLEAIRY